MVSRVSGAACVAVLALAAAAQGQLPEGEAAFRAGDHRAARAAYERVLREDSLNVRALYRLAVLDSWDGELARALERFALLRRLEPHDGDFMVAQARVLAWDGRTSAAESLYDSVLVVTPDRTDALAGRARTVAWAGDLDRAERLWRDALERHPDEPEILVGLAQTLYWKNQARLAESYVARARQVAPAHREARDLLDLIRAAVRPEVGTETDYGRDSDDNAVLRQHARYIVSTGPWRTGVRAAWLRAHGPLSEGWSYGAEGQVVAPLGGGTVLRAGLGAQRLAPEGRSGQTLALGHLGIGVRPARFTSLSATYSRTPLDETAALIDSGFVIDAIDATFDHSTSHGVTVSLAGGAAWLSDENRRHNGTAALMLRVRPGLETGVFGRLLGYTQTGRGYFAPDRFAIIEGRVTYTWRRERWGVRVDGGVGVQQVGMDADGQSEWHGRIQLSRGWGAASELSLVSSWTNSAASSATGAFRYWSVGVRLRQTL